MLTNRIQTLFDDETIQILKQTAQERKTSVGKLIRASVKKDYVSPQKKLQLQKEKAVQAILKLREKFGEKLAKGKDSTQIIREMRDTRYGPKSFSHS